MSFEILGVVASSMIYGSSCGGFERGVDRHRLVSDCNSDVKLYQLNLPSLEFNLLLPDPHTNIYFDFHIPNLFDPPSAGEEERAGHGWPCGIATVQARALERKVTRSVGAVHAARQKSTHLRKLRIHKRSLDNSPQQQLHSYSLQSQRSTIKTRNHISLSLQQYKFQPL